MSHLPLSKRSDSLDFRSTKQTKGTPRGYLFSSPKNVHVTIQPWLTITIIADQRMTNLSQFYKTLQDVIGKKVAIELGKCDYCMAESWGFEPLTASLSPAVIYPISPKTSQNGQLAKAASIVDTSACRSSSIGLT